MKYQKFKCFLSGLLLAWFIAGCNSGGTSAENNEFVEIFDGKSLRGWEGDSIYWKVENGNLVGQITPNTTLEQNTFIIWKDENPANFELKAEFRITTDGNSGVNYRSESVDNVPFGLKGYQADIDGKNNYTGQNYEERGRTTLAFRGEKVILETPINYSGSLSDIVKNNVYTERTIIGSFGDKDSLRDLIESEGWNNMHLIIKDNRMRHYVNDVLMSEVIDKDTINRKLTGKLGIQLHVGPPMKVEFRKLRLKQL